MTDTHYEYRWQDQSILLRLLKEPALLPLVRKLPYRMTPNQVTLIGQCAVWISFAYAAMVAAPSRAVLAALAAGYLLWAVADCIDGEFARHTRRTSRLGELLDHGLDAISIPLVPLGFGIVMQQPAWITLGGAAAAAFIDFATLLHGYRVGYVVLGAIGLNEALAAGALATGVAAIAGPAPLLQPVVLGLSVSGLLLLALIAGALTALVDMRGLARHPGDFAGLLTLLAAVAAWYVWGQVSLLVAGLLITAVSAYVECRLTCARLLQQRVPTSDGVLVALVLAAAALSLALPLDRRQQLVAASLIFAYTLARGGRIFMQTVTALRA